MEDEVMGLGNEPTSKWPKVEIDGEKRPIEAMRPGSSLHARVLQYALERLRMSEEEMQQFYSRWRVQEKKVQAYINLPNWEKVLKALNDSGEPPKAVQIVVPHTYATISTIVTYLMHTFGGRKPMFQVGSYKKETVQAAAMMEIVLQYNADHTRLMKHLFQYFQDGEMYGVQILRTRWNKEEKMRMQRLAPDA